MKNEWSKKERTLFESEKMYFHLAQLMPIAIYTTDKDGIITFFNAKASEIWGRRPSLNNPEEVRYCGSWKIYEPDGTPLPHDKCATARALKCRREFHGEEIAIERPDGSRISALVHVDPVFSANGDLSGAINVITDITRWKNGEVAARRLAAIIESSQDAIISKTLGSIVTSWNKGAEKIFGYTEEEMIGKSITLIIPVSRLFEEDLIIEKICGGERVESFETIRVNKDGKNVAVSLTISPIKDENGRVTGVSKIARDIGEQVKIKSRLKRYNEKLKELNRYKDEFIGTAGHELRTPVTNIKAYLQLAARSDEEEVKIFNGKALAQVNRLSRLVNELLDVSKIQEGGLPLAYSDFNMDKLIDEIIEEMQVHARKHQIIRRTYTNDRMIHADRERISQVIINLLSNAIKYSPDGGEIIVKSFTDADKIIVSIQDFGLGIAKKDQKKIFKRSYRADGNAGVIPGMGIGLFIAEDIIQRHHGNMWVESRLEKGSVFSFSIPAA